MLKLLLFAVFVVLTSADFAVHNIPVFPSSYHVTGVVKLSYATLHEPFEFWVLSNDSFKSSRLDWYNGLDTVIDLPPSSGFHHKRGLQKSRPQTPKEDYGTQYKVSYTTLTNDGSTTRSCFEVGGSAEYPVELDGVLPDLTDFTYGGTVVVDKKQVEMVYMNELIGYKKNQYKFYYDEDADGNAIPIQFSFLGYDNLLGSHYDRYDIHYSVYDTDDISPSVFDINNIVDESTCGDFPGPGAATTEHKIWMNPMHDLVKSSRYPDAHGEFARDYNKDYRNEIERRLAEHKYRDNLRFIHSRNRQALNYKLSVNFMADMDQEERKALLGLKRNTDGRKPTGEKLKPSDVKKSSSIPDYWDWRLIGAVTQVKDQVPQFSCSQPGVAICGSCWSFGTTGTLEGAYFLKYGRPVRLSQQNLMDCSWPEGNNGCDGGEDWRSYEYIQSDVGGLMTEDDYGHYLGQNGMCHFNKSMSVINILNYTFVTGEDESTVKNILLAKGPLSIGIDASLSSFSFYSHGIYDDPQCKNGVDDLDHSVLLVGYGTLSGTDYWLVKNSWSTYWGNLGYVTFGVKNNVCGVMTQPTYVTLA